MPGGAMDLRMQAKFKELHESGDGPVQAVNRMEKMAGQTYPAIRAEALRAQAALDWLHAPRISDQLSPRTKKLMSEQNESNEAPKTESRDVDIAMQNVIDSLNQPLHGARFVASQEETKTASRDNSGKPEIYFIFQFPTSVEAFVRVMEMGSIKYDRDNWRSGGKPYSEYISACGRHLLAYTKYVLKFPGSSYYAPDTGCAHLAHAAWNLFALMDLNHPGMTHDPEVFAKMAEHWAKKKQAA